ncbi:hypothetical protein M9H77_32065 [Catharanthus roseus]|uniref:Uncharacterized protein n=2 Tax=Catharanthus roseus TaxID=4058 RepID=A0ACC0A2T2_CATRO|nr:hypothetical protein M9H77_32063 [Catharanthus roseus]KAI5654878.1 hypothetical protein M9H77_32065 [Catharanthus roseus]
MARIKRVEGTPCVKDIFYEEDAMMEGEDDGVKEVAQRTIDSGSGTVDEDMQFVEKYMDDGNGGNESDENVQGEYNEHDSELPPKEEEFNKDEEARDSEEKKALEDDEGGEEDKDEENEEEEKEMDFDEDGDDNDD